MANSVNWTMVLVFVFVVNQSMVCASPNRPSDNSAAVARLVAEDVKQTRGGGKLIGKCVHREI